MVPQSITNFPGLPFEPLFQTSNENSIDDRFTANCLLIFALFRKNYAMLAAVFGAGFVFEVGFNNGINKWWDNHNRGRQWKDIRSRYVEGGDEDEE
ncbi:hypothetical protein E4U55_002784 [Claviceps digitariae]|nr:hypothetical protein E4U55_002784 [Claviceps digitariae]